MILRILTVVAGISPLLAEFMPTREVFLTPRLYASCEEAWSDGFKQPGVFPVLLNADPSIPTPELRFIYCNNTEARSSTVILMRKTNGENFKRSFAEFRKGFGSARSEYFLGLDHIRSLTNRGFNRLRITIHDAAGDPQQISYDFFKLNGPPDYTYDLSAPGAGDLPDDFFDHRGIPFRAPGNPDARSDGSSCARTTETGWWFQPEGPCAYVLLTGNFRHNRTLYHPRSPYPICDGVFWVDWTGFRSLSFVVMELYK